MPCRNNLHFSELYGKPDEGAEQVKRIMLAMIGFYQRRISPLFPPMCRYYPTCSNYAVQAIEIHGPFKGALLAILRLMRCNILFPGGYDPVPPKKHRHSEDKK